MKRTKLIAVCILALLFGAAVCLIHWRVYSQGRTQQKVKPLTEVDHVEVFGNVSVHDIAGMGEAMKWAAMANPKSKWVEARAIPNDDEHLEIVTHTQPKPQPIKIATATTDTHVLGNKTLTSVTAASTSTSWIMANVAPDATPTPRPGEHAFGNAMRDIQQLNGHYTPTPTPTLGAPLRYDATKHVLVDQDDKTRVLHWQATPVPRLRKDESDPLTPPFEFNQMKFAAASLTIEDTCGHDFRKLECLKLLTPYEPIVQQMDGHWQVTFKMPQPKTP